MCLQCVLVNNVHNVMHTYFFSKVLMCFCCASDLQNIGTTCDAKCLCCGAGRHDGQCVLENIEEM